jgi:hypothetical protein
LIFVYARVLSEHSFYRIDAKSAMATRSSAAGKSTRIRPTLDRR